MTKIYVIGSLRNPDITKIAGDLRKAGYDAFDDWMAAGPEADDYWMKYEKERGHNYPQALAGYAADHVFQFDKHHLDTSDCAVLVMPSGKSAHLELGYIIGKGKPGYILMPEEPERYDVMYKFASGVFFSTEELIKELNKNEHCSSSDKRADFGNRASIRNLGLPRALDGGNSPLMFQGANHAV